MSNNTKKSKAQAQNGNGHLPAEQLEQVQPPPVIQDAVIIPIIRNPDGSVDCPVQWQGDVRITEIETILRVAQEVWRSQITKK